MMAIASISNLASLSYEIQSQYGRRRKRGLFNDSFTFGKPATCMVDRAGCLPEKTDQNI